MTTRIISCIFLILSFGSCDTPNEAPGTEVTITTRALAGSVWGSSQGRTVDLTFDELSIVIADIRLMATEPATDEATSADSHIGYSDKALSGPFHIDFHTDQRSQEQVLVSTVVPGGVYGGIRFRLQGEGEAEIDGNAATVFVSGKIDGSKFALSWKSGKEIEIRDSIFCTSNGEPLFVKLFFNFAYLFSEAGGIDLSLAEDRDNDGVIEIGNNDDDGNEWLIEQLPELIGRNIYLVSGQ